MKDSRVWKPSDDPVAKAPHPGIVSLSHVSQGLMDILFRDPDAGLRNAGPLCIPGSDTALHIFDEDACFAAVAEGPEGHTFPEVAADLGIRLAGHDILPLTRHIVNDGKHFIYIVAGEMYHHGYAAFDAGVGPQEFLHQVVAGADILTAVACKDNHLVRRVLLQLQSQLGKSFLCIAVDLVVV